MPKLSRLCVCVRWSCVLQVLRWHVQERLLPGLLSSASSGRALLMEVACVWGQYKALVHEFQRPFHYLVTTHLILVQQRHKVRQRADLGCLGVCVSCLVRSGTTCLRTACLATP
jgi:hypothetical protein